MKSLIKNFAPVLLVVFLFGCQNKTENQALCRVVTQVDIVCESNGETLQRHYTDEDKMRAVLLYLRLLRIGRPPEINPDTVTADIYEITVTLSDGTKKTYTQKAHQYFKKGQEGWLSISPTQAADLYRLIWFYDSDL